MRGHMEDTLAQAKLAAVEGSPLLTDLQCQGALVPVLTGLQCQGDVVVIPTALLAGRRAVALLARGGASAVGPEGAAVVTGAGGHTHLLLVDGPCSWAPSPSGGAEVGALAVGAGSVAYLAHPEHGYLGIGPGQYVLRRQREALALVAD